MRRRFVTAAAVGFALAAAVVGRATLGPDGLPLKFVGTFATAGTVPACTAAENCVMSCVANAAGDDWVCTGPTGTDLPVTLGTGTDFVGTPFFPAGTGKALNDITDAKAPKLTTASAMDTFWTTPHTVVAGYYATGQTSASIQGIIMHTNAAQTSGFVLREESGQKCIWRNAGAAPAEIAVIASSGVTPSTNGWVVTTCRKIGSGAGSTYNARANGIESLDTAWANNPAQPTGGDFWFGRLVGAGLPLRGPFAFANFYSEAKSDSWVANAEASFYGTLTDGSAVPLTVAKGAKGYQVADDGYVAVYDMTNGGGGKVNASGLLVESQIINAWAADALAAATWTDVGTPIVTSNASSGRFFRWQNAAEADLITDDDAAAMEGKESATAGTAARKYTASCYLGAGTSGTVRTKARISIVVAGGTGSLDCDFTGLPTISSPTDFVRKECTVTAVGAAITSVKARVLVGNATTDTGSILVDGCQLEANGWASSPKATNATTSADDIFIPSAETATWPAGASSTGDIEVVFTTTPDLPGDDSDNIDSVFLVDTRNGNAAGPGIIIWWAQSTGKLNVSTRDGVQTDVAITDTNSTTAVNLVGGQQYVARFRWTPGAVGLNHYMYINTCAIAASCHATTLVGSTTDGTRTVVPSHGPGYLGSRHSHEFYLNGRVARVTVKGR